MSGLFILGLLKTGTTFNFGTGNTSEFKSMYVDKPSKSSTYK